MPFSRARGPTASSFSTCSRCSRAGRASIASAAHGIEDGERVDDVLEQVLAYDADLVCATFMTRDLPGFRTLLPRIKQHSDAFISVGGYHTTSRPREVAQWPGIDAIGIGE